MPNWPLFFGETMSQVLKPKLQLQFFKDKNRRKAHEYREFLVQLAEKAKHLEGLIADEPDLKVTNYFKNLNEMDTNDVNLISYLYIFCLKNPGGFLNTQFDFVITKENAIQ